MNRTVFRLGAAALCLAGLMGCGAEPQPEAEDDQALTPETAIAAMVEANTDEAIMGRHERFAIQGEMILQSGETFYLDQYWDKDLFYTDTDYEWIVQTADRAYGYDKLLEGPVEYLPIGYTMETGFGLTDDFHDTEIVDSMEEVDGQLVIHSHEDKQDWMDDVLAMYSYEPEEVQQFLYEYAVDPDTLELRAAAISAVLTDGSTQLFQKLEATPDPEAFVPDEEVTALVHSEDTRTLTVVLGPGTEQEKVQTYQVGKGVAAFFLLSEDMDPVVYTDAACTAPIEEDLDPTVDHTVYLKYIG